MIHTIFFLSFSCVLVNDFFKDMIFDNFLTSENNTYILTMINANFFYHLRATQHELDEFLSFSCMLAHEYFGDMSFGRFLCETFMDPYVGS